MKARCDGALSAKDLNPRELNLTCKGLSCVNWDYGEADFEFIVGDDKVLRVQSVLAEFLSPKIANIRKCDPFCYVYAFKNSELFDVVESLVLSLRSGQSLHIEKSNFVALFRLSQELENDELFSSLLEMITNESLDLEEAILLLRAGIDLGSGFSNRFGSLRDFIASRFYEIDKSILEDLDLETSQILLSSPSLRVEDEDSLYDFVKSRSERDFKFASLFEFIYFECLSVTRMEDFASFVSENLLETINSAVWRRICGRLFLETKYKTNPRTSTNNSHNSNVPYQRMTCRPPRIEFIYDSSKPLDGIIAYLTRECGGNVHTKGIVNVTASSVYLDTDWCQPKNVVDLGTNSLYYSNNEKNTWLCYEFKDGRVIPTSYSLRSYNSGPGGDHLKSWVVEVSNDGLTWQEIDRRENNHALNDQWVRRNFKISNVPRESFKFFRLRQTGQNHRGFYHVKLSSMEIFGTLC